MRSVLSVIKRAIFGVVLGIANIIPGISAGTMAVVLGIYDKTIFSIANFKKQAKTSLFWLIPLIVGILVGIVAFANIMEQALLIFPIPTKFFFIGVILGSLPMIFKRATADGFKAKYIVPFLITLAVMIAMFVFRPDSGASDVDLELTFFEYVLMFLSGVLAAGAMVIPGISGSFLMLMLGQYGTILAAISSFNWAIIGLFLAGSIVGIVGVSKLIGILIARHPQAMYFAILGFVVGSVPELYPGFTFDWMGVAAIACLLVGAAAAYFFSLDRKKAPDDAPSPDAGEADSNNKI